MAVPSRDISFTKNMGCYLNDFFHSLQGDGGALKSFLGTLSSFSAHIQAPQSNADVESLVALHSFASIVDTVATSVLELEDATDKIGLGVLNDVSKILSAKLSDLTISENSITKTSKKTAPFPAYIRPSYEWLLSNLHNPYPSREMKKSIALQTQCSVKDIDAWFTDVRKRIGWNKLRKTKFSNKQEKIIAAATHFFSPKPTSFTEDLRATLLSEMDPHDAYRRDFVMIASDAKRLYADKFPELVSPKMLFQPGTETSPIWTSKKQQDSHESPTPLPQVLDANAIMAYPTPEPSPGSYISEEMTPYPACISESSPTVTRKRRQSSPETCETDFEHMSARPSKRIRTSQLADALSVATLRSSSKKIDFSYDRADDSLLSPSTIDTTAIVGPPSPSNTIDLLEDSSEDNPSSPLLVAEQPTIYEMPNLKRKRRLSDGERRDRAKHPHLSFTPEAVAKELPVVSEISRLKRKRRLSDGESQCSPKRPHNAFAIPRLQTASNPLPMTKPSPPDLFETWTQDHILSELDPCGIPSPANFEDTLSMVAPLDVSYGQYDVFATYFDPCREETSSNLATESPDVSASFPENSESCSDFADPLYFPLQNAVLDIDVSTATLPNFNELITAPTYDDLSYIPFSDCLQQSLSSSEWSAYLQSGNSYISESLAPISVETANLTYLTPRALPDPNLADSKRARIQALNEQIRQLEAEL